MSYTNTNNSICWYDNAVPNELCDDLIQLYEANKDYHLAGKTLEGVADVKISTDMALCSPEFGNDSEDKVRFKTILDDELAGFVNNRIYEYISVFDWITSSLNTYHTNYVIQKYQAMKGQYQEHIDGASWSEPSRERICGIIVYLNDVEEGGGTYFRHQNTYIDAKKGRIAIFPANWTHPHTGTVPISSDKYIVTSFLMPAEILSVKERYVL